AEVRQRDGASIPAPFPLYLGSASQVRALRMSLGVGAEHGLFAMDDVAHPELGTEPQGTRLLLPPGAQRLSVLMPGRLRRAGAIRGELERGRALRLGEGAPDLG